MKTVRYDEEYYRKDQQEIMHPTTRILETNRLYQRLIDRDDLSFLTQLHQDPEVMRYIGPPRSKERVAKRIESIISDYKSHPGYGIWMACLRETGVPIGWAALKDLDGTDQIEIGYRLARDYWGFGYATELAQALIHYGFSEKPLDHIAGVTTPDNMASQKVLEKAGLIHHGSGHFYGSELFYYKITRERWLDLVAMSSAEQ